MVARLREHYGISDPRVLDAMRNVPRHFFVPEALQSRAYGDHALPISANQTISQPFIVARMTELLELDAGEDRSRARELAKERVDALNATIAQLQQARDALVRLATACSNSNKGPCPILTSFDA